MSNVVALKAPVAEKTEYEVVQLLLSRVLLTDETYMFRAQLRVGDIRSSLKAVGQLTPIIVREMPDRPGYYQIVAGFRRTKAAKDLSWNRIAAVVRDDLSDRAACRVSVLENTGRKGYTMVDKAIAAARLQDEGYTTLQSAEMMGLSKGQVKELRSLLALPPIVQEAVSNPDTKMGLSHAFTLRSIARKWPGDFDYDHWVHRIETEELTVYGLREALRLERSEQAHGEATIRSLFANNHDPTHGVVKLRATTIELATLTPADVHALRTELWAILGYLKAQAGKDASEGSSD